MSDIDEGLEALAQTKIESIADESKKDSRANAESQAFKSDSLLAQTDEECRRKQLGRDETTRDNIHGIFIWGLRAAAAGLALVFIVRVIHLIGPDCITWLEPERVSDVDKILFSGALGAIISKYLGPIMRHR